MTKSQRNHRNATPGKVSNVTKARSISYQKQPSSIEMQQQISNATESDIIQKQQKIIEELLERVGRLEGTVSAMEGKLAVVRNVNMTLSRKMDEADQYHWRLCMIVMGLQKPGKTRQTMKIAKKLSQKSQGKLGWMKENSWSMYLVTCTCNPATLKAEFPNGVGSMPVGGNSPSIGGWIVWPSVIQH